MLRIIFSRQFERDLKACIRRGLPKDELIQVVDRLANGEQLEPRFRPHRLKGDYNGFTECHLRPDWLLVYNIDAQNKTLLVYRTGSHADLFS